MQTDENIPDPDAILEALQLEEKRAKQGKLTIFFGMAAGAGKTYSMLEEAQQRLKEGVDVVVGTINTHGRQETENLLQGLRIIPEKWVKYKDTVFEELDLETILAMKPQLVLVDELAHSNVPGSKHPKRWQDVIEFLDAGIDVYTTLNVQHLETRKDLVEGITGISIRETVPDLILERAMAIKFIDITPSTLLQRLKEGKVYLGDHSLIAAQNFFKEDKLTALREIALRFTAEKVEHDLRQGQGWKTHAKLMVAISPSPSSQQLIRTTRRLAFQLNAPWIAVFVDTGAKLNDKDQTRLTAHMNLARDLGAEVMITHDMDVAIALKRVATQKDVTSIIVGRPPNKRWGLFNRFQKTFLERLENENKQINILILRQDPITSLYQKTLPKLKIVFSWCYRLAFLIVAVSTILGYLLEPFIGHQFVGLLFLIGIMLITFFADFGPILLTAIASAFAWDFFFLSPRYTLKIPELADWPLLIVYFLTVFVMGRITSNQRKQESFLRRREEQLERLYETEKEIVNAKSIQSLRLNLISRLQAIFPGQCDVLIQDEDNQLVLESPLTLLQQDKEKAAAIWVFQNGKLAGWTTDTLPSSEGIYFPISFSTSPVGVLVYHPRGSRPLSLDEINFLQTIAQQLGSFLERHILDEKLAKQDYTRQIEKIHQAIFRSLNRSFYGPLEEMLQISGDLQDTTKDPQVQLLLKKIETLQFKLKLIVNNIIAIAKLESGFVHFVKKEHHIQKLIDDALKEVDVYTHDRLVNLQIQTHPSFLSFDYEWLKVALDNLLINACEYSPPKSPISISVEAFEKEFRLTVTDEGAGIPKELLPLIFEKFYRVPGTSTGMGLGLAIVKRVVEIHQGKIEVEKYEKDGTAVTLILPM